MNQFVIVGKVVEEELHPRSLKRNTSYLLIDVKVRLNKNEIYHNYFKCYINSELAKEYITHHDSIEKSVGVVGRLCNTKRNSNMNILLVDKLTFCAKEK